MAFQSPCRTHVWPTRRRGWRPRSLSWCPHCSRREGRSQGEFQVNWKITERGRVDGGIFQAASRRELSPPRRNRTPPLPSLSSCQRPPCLVPCEQTVWWEIPGPTQRPGHLDECQVTPPQCQGPFPTKPGGCRPRARPAQGAVGPSAVRMLPPPSAAAAAAPSVL